MTRPKAMYYNDFVGPCRQQGLIYYIFEEGVKNGS